MLGTALAASLPASLPALASTPDRVALVIGNAAYRHAPLANPANDARAMAGQLRRLGFEVLELVDGPHAAMVDAIARVRERLAGRRGTGLLYYAGHGLQLDWRNYMVPVDAEIETAADIRRRTVDVQQVVEAFGAAGNRVNIVVLDACRDNPFGGVASGRGLAPVDAPPGTFLAYATAPGHLAEDGSARDGNGLYTRFLLQELQRRDARIEDIFKRVRLQVRQASRGRQIPWESTSLEDDFVFASGQPVTAPEPLRRDAEFDAEKAEWDRIATSGRADDFYAFLQRHPSGRISELAQFRLDQLARPAVQAPPARPGLQALPAGSDRFRIGDSWEFERTDLLAGGRTQRLPGRVTAIDNGRVVINGGAMVVDQMGGILVNRFGTKDPVLLGIPDGLQVGKRWRTAFTNAQPGGPSARSYYEFRVSALEEVEVPAGRFQAFRIEGEGEGRTPRGSRGLWLTNWVDPATMTLVRHEVRQSDRAGGQVIEHTRDVLLWRRQVPRG